MVLSLSRELTFLWQPYLMSCLKFYMYAFIKRRGIEWSLHTFASTRALRLFLRAQAVIKFVLRAASTLENTTGEQRTDRINCLLILHVGLLECA